MVNLGEVCSSKSSKSLCSDLFDDGAVADDDDCIGISSEDEESLVSSFNDGILDVEWEWFPLSWWCQYCPVGGGVVGLLTMFLLQIQMVLEYCLCHY